MKTKEITDQNENSLWKQAKSKVLLVKINKLIRNYIKPK